MRDTKAYFTEIIGCIISSSSSIPIVQSLMSTVRATISSEGQIFVIGNGGSMANASHFAEDLRVKYPRVLTLDSIPLVSAIANDFGYENIFVRQLANLIKAGDLLIALSVSGNSKNIIEAVKYAESVKANVFIFTGETGGQLANHHCLKVKSKSFGIVESLHLALLHWLSENV